MTDRLFDGFGEPKTPRKRTKRGNDVVLVLAPWVLLGSARDIPRAHILAEDAKPTKEGAWPAVCGKQARRITLEKPGWAPKCKDCARITGRKT